MARSRRPPSRASAAEAAAVVFFLLAAAAALLAPGVAGNVQITSKSRVETCVHDSGDAGGGGGGLACGTKLLVDLIVSSGSSGSESSLVEVETAEVEQHGGDGTGGQALRRISEPPKITINKSEAHALYDLEYMMDVAYRPEEHFVKTRRCEPDAGADVVKNCERLRYQNWTIIEHTEPYCCPCSSPRTPQHCGAFFFSIFRGKANTAHCLRFLDDWFHVFAIGARTIWFTIKVQVQKGSFVSEVVVVGPGNKTVVSKDNFMRVSLVGDFSPYTSFPLFEGSYLVTPRKGPGDGQPKMHMDEFSRWMVMEKEKFTLDGQECNKVGVGYEAFNSQPDFCSSPFGSCLHNQLWNFWEADKERINKGQQPQYVVHPRYKRINQHPNAGIHSFSIEMTEPINTNLLLELSADNIKYVYQRSPGEIICIDISTFETLSQVGAAYVTTKNTGKYEASYSMTFNCSSGINPMEEQVFVMKPNETNIRSFSLRASTDQASTYQCEAILKASDSSEVDRRDQQFSTTSTVFHNATQIPSDNHPKGDKWRFFKDLWHKKWPWLLGGLALGILVAVILQWFRTSITSPPPSPAPIRRHRRRKSGPTHNRMGPLPREGPHTYHV